jgi:hypothetical protein
MTFFSSNQFQSNSFSLTSPHLDNIGVSISPLVALLNHSCSPNAVVVFPNFANSANQNPMRVVAIRDIAPGEEILTSYVDLALPRHLRQTELHETYRFWCKCTECTKSPQNSWELWCDRDGSTQCPFKEKDPEASREHQVSHHDARSVVDTLAFAIQSELADQIHINQVTCPLCGTRMSWSESSRAEAISDAAQALDEARSMTYSSKSLFQIE